jgi:uncharacterized protein YcbX
MWQIKPSIDENTNQVSVTCALTTATKKKLVLPVYGAEDAKGMFELGAAEIWGNQVDLAVCVDEKVNAWFSAALGSSVRLCNVLTEDQHTRKIGASTDVSNGEMEVAFNDGYPVNMITDGSMAELHRRLAAQGSTLEVPVERFRTNIFIACEDDKEAELLPHFEDHWVDVGIGEVSFHRAHPTSRCVIPTIDPSTSTHTKGYEPIRTLRTYRTDCVPKKKSAPGVYFGQHFIQGGFGTVRIGDKVSVMKTGPSNVTTNGNFRRGYHLF